MSDFDLARALKDPEAGLFDEGHPLGAPDLTELTDLTGGLLPWTHPGRCMNTFQSLFCC
ncbi:hypothetical protein ACFWXK_30330 [Streptomyces sp. NPDC059070]|uniref:hypothetical protein n=1 Tax=Streptomyces sp. NPDC059070 TaxID=3346713 RepID=UPI00369FF851